MKLAPAIAILATATLILGACKEKKQHTDEGNIITTRYIPKRPIGPIALPADSQQVSANWLGTDYSVSIKRTPIDSMTVSDENGQKYIDNRVRLSVRRQDGSAFVEKNFFKSSFSSYVQEPFKSSGILSSIRFDGVENAKLKFIVVVAMPEATDDLFIPLKMTIDGQGGLSIVHDDDMGMLEYDRYEGNDDDGV